MNKVPAPIVHWSSGDMFRVRDFVNPDYQLVNSPLPGNAELLAGHMHDMQALPGMWLHCVEARDMQTLSARTSVDPGLHVVVLLEGMVDVSLGGQSLIMHSYSSQDACPGACGAVIHTKPGDFFERRWQQGKFERKLSITLSPQWLEALQGIDNGVPARLNDWMHNKTAAIQRWQPSSRAVAIAEQLIQLTRQNSSRMLIGSRALELVHEALHLFEAHPGQELEYMASALAVPERHRLGVLLELLNSKEGQTMALPDISRKMGMSMSALQRKFRLTYGSTIDEYRRIQRLNKARASLENAGFSVSEAAYLAGYGSAANFATAFKRQFGISPKLVRARA